MELVVLNIAYPFAAVSHDAPNEVERVVAQLDATLTETGHDSFVMACEGSITEGILLSTRKPMGIPDEIERHHIREQYRYTLKAFLEKWPIDLIHMHGADFYQYLPPPGVPVLVTLHQPLDQYPETIFRIERPQTFLHCVSAEQRNACPPCSNLLSEIETGFGLDSVDKYVSIYERLVEEARGLETAMEAVPASEYGETSAEAVPA